MTTRIFTVPTGQSQVFPAPVISSVCVQPGTGGTSSISYGPTPLGPFTAAPQGANTAPYSLCTSTYSGTTSGNLPTMGNVGFVQIAATTAATNVLISDLSQYPGSFPERQTVFQTGVAFTTIASSTAELELFSIRFPANYFQLNFKLFCEFQLTLTNSANVKTINAYFGSPTINSGTAAALELASGNKIWSNVYTSMSGAEAHFALAGRNDGQTVICSNPGLLSAGGWGSSTTTNVTLTSQNYNAGTAGLETALVVTATKATGADTITLDSAWVQVIH